MTRVLAHHGTSRLHAEKILAEGFVASVNAWDWLGDGIYFWETNFYRARAWAVQNHKDAVVVEVEIDLEDCFDLTNPEWFALLNRNADRILAQQKAAGLAPLKQTDLFHGKDRYVINILAEAMLNAGRPFKSVRGAFSEGSPAFPSSAIFSQSHVQIAVRDPSVIHNLVVHPIKGPR